MESMSPPPPPPIRKISPATESSAANAPRVTHAPPFDPLETIPTLGEQANAAEAPTEAQAIERMLCEQVTISYGSKIAVNAVDLPVRQGEVLALIGPSGCGKTTLLRSLNRLTELTPTAARGGRITLDHQDIDELEVTHLRRRVSMVFQQPNPFPMSIYDNIAYALREHGEKRRRKPKRSELEPKVIDALTRAGLYEEVRDDLNHPALRLSGGQQQRLCIARALAASPEVLLLDEPCSALDPRSTAVIEELLIAAQAGGGDRDRHPQPPAGEPDRRPDRVHVPRRAGRVRDDGSGVRLAPRPAHP